MEKKRNEKGHLLPGHGGLKPKGAVSEKTKMWNELGEWFVQEGAAIWSKRDVLTCVSKSETVAANCVPVWLARAYGSVTILAAVIVPSAISVATMVPSTKSAEVILPLRLNLL